MMITGLTVIHSAVAHEILAGVCPIPLAVTRQCNIFIYILYITVVWFFYATFAIETSLELIQMNTLL